MMFLSPWVSPKFSRTSWCLTPCICLGFWLAGPAGGQAEAPGLTKSATAVSEIIETIYAASKPLENPVTFSDADEVAGSDSKVTATTTATGLRLTYKINGYGGVVLRNGIFDEGRLSSLRLRIWQIDGKPLQPLLQFTSKTGVPSTFPIDALPIASAGDHRERIVPFGHFTAFNSALLSENKQVSLVLPAGSGVLEIESMALVSGSTPIGAALPPVPAKSKVALPKGLGAWCYASPAFIVDEVSRYNKSAAPNQRIRYLFPATGVLDITAEGQPSLRWEKEVPASLRKALDQAGLQDVMILPMIEGLTDNLSRVSDADAKKIAQEIGTFIEGNPACNGVNFDLEPDDAFVYVILAALRESTGKPITAAVATGDADLFRYTDMAVIMAYDVAYTPEKYDTVITQRIDRFLKLAGETKGRAMIGVPAIATHHEHTSTAASLDGPRDETGHTMVEYVGDAFRSTEQAVKAGAVPAFAGYCIWAIHEPEAIHGGADTQYYFPGHVAPDVWALLHERAFP